MHKLKANVDVGQQELSELRLVLERQVGVLLDTTAEELTRAISEVLRSHPVASAGLLMERLRSSGADCELLAEHLLDGQTRFFRHPAALRSLATLVLPELEKRKPEHPRNLRILSAGCSTGEEPYSIGVTVCEVVNCSGGGWSVNIVASDIRRQALETAERGLYPQAALKDIPAHLVQPYFAQVGEHLLVKPRLRNLVRFAPMNLARPSFLGQFDCIFCMDVLPRFSYSQRTMLMQRLHLYLEPGGYLFLGENERLPSSEVKFQPQVRDGYTVYQKAAALAAKSGR